MSTLILNHKKPNNKKNAFSELNRSHERKRILFILSCFLCFTGCATSLPEERHDTFHFPEKSVYVEEPIGEFKGRPYEILGWVRAKAHFPTLEQDPNSQRICKNYYNKASRDLLKQAIKEAKGDAVMKVRSVVMLMNGKTEEHVTPECSDDGAEGEILLRGIAIKWKPLPEEEKK